MDEVPTTKVLSIRECGHDEYWLRDKIYEDPAILRLGDLQSISKERTQSQGGRLDLLLKDPEDDSMFEVELQLGPTDETHIIGRLNIGPTKSGSGLSAVTRLFSSPRRSQPGFSTSCSC